jgi:hypothetical protein
MLESDRDRAARRLDRELGNRSPGRDLLDETPEILAEHRHRFPESAGENEAEPFSCEIELSDDRLHRPHELAGGIVDDALSFAIAEVRRLLYQGSERGDLFPRELPVHAVHESLRMIDAQLFEDRSGEKVSPARPS